MLFLFEYCGRRLLLVQCAMRIPVHLCLHPVRRRNRFNEGTWLGGQHGRSLLIKCLHHPVCSKFGSPSDCAMTSVRRTNPAVVIWRALAFASSARCVHGLKMKIMACSGQARLVGAAHWAGTASAWYVWGNVARTGLRVCLAASSAGDVGR